MYATYTVELIGRVYTLRHALGRNIVTNLSIIINPVMMPAKGVF